MLSIINDLKNHYPVAGGGFSDIYLIEGKIVKVLEDGCWSDTIVETVLQKQAADAGLAPQVHGITTKGDEVIVVMDSVPSGFVNLGDDDLVPYRQLVPRSQRSDDGDRLRSRCSCCGCFRPLSDSRHSDDASRAPDRRIPWSEQCSH